MGGFKVFGVEKVFCVEVEDKLKSLPCMEVSAVIAIPDEARPANDVVNLDVQRATESMQTDPHKLREEILKFCRDNLAPDRVPEQIHFNDQIPLTAVGKIDKKRLRKTVS